ncbi:MAG: prolyl oligopeptidase family serine peptidase [Pseudomonadota bacterium]
MIGHSAGAHIAALLAGNARYISDISSETPPPQKFIGLSGPYAFDPTTWDTTKHIFTRAQATPEIARPIALATADFPETLLIHGARDEIVTPNASTEFHDALTAAGARSHLHIVRHLGHAGPVLAFAKPLRWWGPTLRLITAFVRPGGDVRKQQRRVKTAEVAPIA